MTNASFCLDTISYPKCVTKSDCKVMIYPIMSFALFIKAACKGCQGACDQLKE